MFCFEVMFWEKCSTVICRSQTIKTWLPLSMIYSYCFLLKFLLKLNKYISIFLYFLCNFSCKVFGRCGIPKILTLKSKEFFFLTYWCFLWKILKLVNNFFPFSMCVYINFIVDYHWFLQWKHLIRENSFAQFSLHLPTLFCPALLRCSWHIINCTYLQHIIWWLLYTCETINIIKVINISVTPKMSPDPLLTLSQLQAIIQLL